MELNSRRKKLFQLFLILILLVVIIITISLVFFKPGFGLKPFTEDQLNKIYKVEPNLYELRNELQIIFVNEINQRQLNNITTTNLKCFLEFSFTELKDLLLEFEVDDLHKIKDKAFLKYFLKYLRNNKSRYITNNCLFHNCSFIDDLGKNLYNKYKLAIETYNLRRQVNILDISFKDYFNRIGAFLANYKHVERNKNFIKVFTRKTPFIIKNQSLFKRTLTFIWKVGSYIVHNLQNDNPVEEEISIFNKYLNNIYDLSYIKGKGFPFKYDWFLFASYYPTVLCYKLYIDYKTKHIINQVYILEILKFIPQINYSRHILRFKSNVAIMSISFIIANFFMYANDMSAFKNFMLTILNSDIFYNDILIQYQEPHNGQFIDGLYFDGGFIIHKNLVSYNYLTAYLYPSLFYKVVFNIDTNNINKIFKAIYKFIIPNRKVNPVIISRYGKFNETTNVINEFLKHSNSLNITYNNVFFNEYKKIQDGNLDSILGIHVTESSRVVVGNFSNWSIQIKINSELAYGEVDIYNKQILKQISMSKIMFFDDMEIKEFEEHSLYPGVLSYKRYLEKAETFEINYGTNTFTFEKVKYSYIKLDKKTIIIYSIVKNKEIKIGYEEVVIITEIGIVVGYFNIKKYVNDDLYLTIDSDIINKFTTTGILHSDDESMPQLFNTAVVKKVNNNILYYNKIKDSPKIISNLYVENNNIIIDISIQKKYKIILDKINGLYVYLN